MGTNAGTWGFPNDMVTFLNRDNVLTLLIHLGSLAYDEEIRLEFARVIRQVKRDYTLWLVRESGQLTVDTVRGEEEAVAGQIERIHEMETLLQPLVDLQAE